MHEETILWTLNLGGTVMTFHGKTLVMTWLVMAIIITICMLGVRNLTSGKPGKMQNLLEWVVDFVRNLVSDNMDYKKGRVILPYLVTLIMFVFFSNMIGLVPNFLSLLHYAHIELPHFAHLNEIFHGATLQSPTADINTTISLASLTFILIFVMGIRDKGLHYFHHFVEPVFLFCPIHIIDMLSKPLTLAFRLFGNIFAGEVLIMVILTMPGIWVLPGALPLVIWLGFSIFIGAIQSFVFTILTTAYVSQAVADAEH